MWHIDQEVLEKAYISGRFKSEPTVCFTTLEHDEDLDVPKFSLQWIEKTGSPPKYHGIEMGFCREVDINGIFALAARCGDTHRTNPNLQVFQSAMRQMLDFEEGIADIIAAEAAAHKVVSFADFRR